MDDDEEPITEEDSEDVTSPTARARDVLYINDAELIRRIGIPEKKARHLLRYFDNNPKIGFPKRDKLFDNRRYWPAVRAFLDRRNGLAAEVGLR